MNDHPRPVGDVCYNWWRSAQASDTGRARKTRAQLRRADTPLAALSVAEVHRLNKALSEAGYGLQTGDGPDRLALIAVALAHVNDGHGATAPCRFGAGKPPPLSLIRFEALIRTKAPRDLIRPMARALKIIGGKADVRALARDLFYWSECTRTNWCFDYHGAGDARPDTKIDEEATA